MNQSPKNNQTRTTPSGTKPNALELKKTLGTSELEFGVEAKRETTSETSPKANLEASLETSLETGLERGLEPGLASGVAGVAGVASGLAYGTRPNVESSSVESGPEYERNIPSSPAPSGTLKQQLLSLTIRILRKLIWMLIVFFGITAISFWVIHLAPGTPTDLQTTMNPFAGEEARLRLNTLYGLDKPLTEQYISWVSRMAQLDFGNSMSSDSRPVWDKIKERLPLTLGMNIASLILTLIIAVPIGIISACRQGGLFDRVSTIFVFIGFAMPGFWLALLLMMLFAIELDWLPVSGITSFDFESLSLWGKFCDLAQHLAMPLFVYTFGSLAAMSRFMRSSMLEVLRQDYITTARAKGLPWRKVIGKHALRNALLPLITLLGLSIPGLIGGSVIIESIFALPGLGQLFYGAVLARDYPLIMGNLVLGAMLTLAGNMLADLAYGIADPRIRRGAKI